MIYDEIHGFIEINDIEKEIIDTPVFQRLRHITQIGLAYLVYPGATHTRFSHSIGVLHLANKVGNNLLREEYLSQDEVQLLRLAALLHDIGHYPLSHSLEICLTRLYGERAHHERLTVEILRRSIIADKLRENGYEPKDIIDILKGSYVNKLLTQIISSDVDVDKMDYLLRDSKHTGIAYGIIDIDRLVSTTAVDNKGDYAFLEKGLGALENLYLARLQMYKTVYYHKTVVAFELMLSEIYKELMEQGEIPSLNEIYRSVSSEESVFFNDHYIYNKIYDIIRNEPLYPKDIVKYVRMLISRKPLKIILDESRYFLIEGEISLPEGKSLFHRISLQNGIFNFETVVHFVRKPVKIIRGANGLSLVVTSDEVQSIIKYIPKGLIIKRAYTSTD